MPLAVAPLLMAMAPNPTMSQLSSPSWLDQPLMPWNRPTPTAFPTLPKPGPGENIEQCESVIRQPATTAEQAIAKQGWHLVGDRHQEDRIQMILGASGFDGMCRPMGYQVFVYAEGRYAGTLSPELMDARTDGSLNDFRVISPSEIVADFNRYGEADPLCCPSGTTRITYTLRHADIPDLLPTGVNTRQNANGSSMPPAGTLLSTPWRLVRVGTESVPQESAMMDTPYLQFDAKEKRFFGSSGCNRYMGSFEQSEMTLNFSAVASTKRACLDQIQKIEGEFYQALGQITRFEINQDQLYLYKDDGEVVLVFQKKES
ncbi:META domain-containing protein [Candidatus Synechococcus calcipolaris G9]|uniref:META domain-containing protein n=1 Tax=Candidatus Synechococcus calcipolaris G9 TaxID=1497997 RepID=A0ABT6F0A4_9SYNE|nr:META domain-containing protein [Candidatus Synechococcus calcipolaris]MDG2991250.1 META domain-containing protein [Candidatus Synechococcus calcipolaris G9]